MAEPVCNFSTPNPSLERDSSNLYIIKNIIFIYVYYHRVLSIAYVQQTPDGADGIPRGSYIEGCFYPRFGPQSTFSIRGSRGYPVCGACCLLGVDQGLKSGPGNETIDRRETRKE